MLSIPPDNGMPFDSGEGEVLPEWIDSNDHMNLAYYIVLFDRALDVLYDHVGLGAQYKATTNFGTFAAESHVLYEKELRLGDRVRLTTQVLGVDAKRLHLAHEMLRVGSDERVATQELLNLHVDLGARRVTAWPPDIQQALQQVADQHSSLPTPTWVGRRISMRPPSRAQRAHQ